MRKRKTGREELLFFVCFVCFVFQALLPLKYDLRFNDDPPRRPHGFGDRGFDV